MNSKSTTATLQTWPEARDNGVLPHEYIETVKMVVQQIYPDSLDTCTLETEIMNEINRADPRNAEDGVAPIALNFEAAAGAGAAVMPDTPIAERAGNRKRAAGTALESIRYTPQPEKLEARMTEAKRTAALKQRGQFIEQEQNIAKVEAELRRVFESECGTELTLRSKGRINARDLGYGFQLYWFFYQTRVMRMTMPRYNELMEQMQFLTVTGKYTTPEEIMIRLDRYFEAFEEAGRKMSDYDKERLLIKAINDSFGEETGDYVRGLPRLWNLNKKDYVSSYEMMRSAMVMHVGDRQRWPGVTTPSKIKSARTEDSKESPLFEELQELKSQVAKLTQAAKSNPKEPRKRRFEPRGLKRAPEAADSKDIWADKAPCGFHCYTAGRTTATDRSHTNAVCKLRDASDPTYNKNYDDAVKKFIKK